MKLLLQPQILSIVQLPANTFFPEWLSAASGFYSITNTRDEYSIVCEQNIVPSEVTANHGWRAFKVDGVLDFSLTGILYQLAKPLAEANISIFAISTFNTDYILVKSEYADKTKWLWQNLGHEVI